MASLVLRAAGPGFDLDAFLRRHPDVVTEATWHVGDVRIPGRRAAQTSGFNLCLADNDDDVAAVGIARVALDRLTLALEDLRELGIPATVDLGLFVGAEFSRNLRLPPLFLKRLVELGLDLEISAYPCDDDDDDSAP